MTPALLLAMAAENARFAKRLAAHQCEGEAMQTELAGHTAFFDEAPNITQYEQQIRLAQLLGLKRRIEEHAATHARLMAGVHRFQLTLLAAGLPVTVGTANDDEG